jgi:hypothetical protein
MLHLRQWVFVSDAVSQSYPRFSLRRLSWLRINGPVAGHTASLDVERGVNDYSGGFSTINSHPFQAATVLYKTSIIITKNYINHIKIVGTVKCNALWII